MGEASPVTEHVYKNELNYEKCHDILVTITADVHFIFETEAEVVKVPANKACLSASSPVFDVMFNGQLKEEDDIKIVDVPPAAFKEFLQFFYKHEVKLTMNNISDVVKLMDKYDVRGASEICIKFLMENLTCNDYVWGLHLAIKFRLDKLKTFCYDKIKSNYKMVLDQINFDTAGKFIAVSKDQRHSEIDWSAVLPHIHMVSQSVVRKISQQLEVKRAVYCITLTEQETSYDRLTRNETIVFQLDQSMLLTGLVCSKVFQYNDEVEHTFDMSIDRKAHDSSWYPEQVYGKKIKIDQGKNSVNLSSPILVEPHYLYAINFRSCEILSSQVYTTYKSIVRGTMAQLAPNVTISFPMENNKKSLISTMYFTHLNEH